MAVSVEAYLISAVLRNRDLKVAMGQGLTTDMFHTFQKEWEWVELYYQKYQNAPSKEAFKRQFPDFAVKQVDDTKHFADEVRKNHARQLMLAMMQDAADCLADGDVDRAVKMANSSIIQIAAAMGTNHDGDIFADFADILQDVESRARRVAENGTAGIPFGIPSIDNRTGGANPGELIIVGGRLGIGKSWQLQYFAANAALLGHSIQFDALEQSRSQVAMRIHALMAGSMGRQVFSNTSLMQGKGFNMGDYKQFLRKLKSDVAGRMHVSDTSRGRVGVTNVAAQIERNHVDVVYVDYLTLMQKNGPDWQGIAQLSGDMKALATNYQIPVICAAQLNRQDGVSGSRRGEPPGVEALAGSDSIGQDADMVITLAKASKHVMVGKMAKYRNGEDNYIWYQEFDPERGVMAEISGNKAQTLIDADKDAEDAKAVTAR